MDQTILESHVEKPDFCRWQHKMLFYLTSLHVPYVLTDSESTDSYLVDGENVPTEAQVADYERIWKSLKKKYMTQVACSKKFVVGKFLNFKINDAKPVVKQVEELQIIIHEMKVEGMGINSNFIVGSLIEKLPQSWKNFKLYLKHLTDYMSFEQLVLEIRFEKDNIMNEKADANSIETNANMVRESSSKSKSNHKNKGKK
ncbi:hypothetical protein Tco_1416470 [Tanacetum coccineum]